MRVDQIHSSGFSGWTNLATAFVRSKPERGIGDRRLAVPQSPGRAKRIHPYPPSRLYRRR
jgi:hypothetical protein